MGSPQTDNKGQNSRQKIVGKKAKLLDADRRISSKHSGDGGLRRLRRSLSIFKYKSSVNSSQTFIAQMWYYVAMLPLLTLKGKKKKDSIIE